MLKVRIKRTIALVVALISVLIIAGCNGEDSSVTTTEYITQNQGETASELVSESYAETEYTTPETQAPSTEAQTVAPNTQASPVVPTTLPPVTEAPTPVATGDVVISSGTRGGVVTFHMDSNTYDLYVPQYYLSTRDVSALKALIKLKPLIPEEAKPFITTEDGYDAIGPVEIAFSGDTFTVSGTTLSFGNTKPSRLAIMPDWGDLPYKTPSATATSSGLTVTFIISGGDGKYDCPVSTFNFTADECRAIGLAV